MTETQLCVIIGDIWSKPKKSKSVPNPIWTNMNTFCKINSNINE